MNTSDIIRRFIANELLHGVEGKPLANDDSLIDSGIIDSLGVMSLLAFIESEFALEISGEDLIPENFATISAITALVDRQRVR